MAIKHDEELEQQEVRRNLPPPEILERLAQMKAAGTLPPPDVFFGAVQSATADYRKGQVRAAIAAELVKPDHQRDSRKVRELQAELKSLRKQTGD